MGRFSYIMKWLLLEKPLKLLILLIVLFSVAAWGSDMDKSALMEFKASIQDPNGVLSSWNSSNSDHCSWEGVFCDSGFRVIALNVTGGGNSLSCARISQFPLYGFGIRRSCVGRLKVLGAISASIAKLSELKILSLPFNELNGEIPVEIWGMQKLEVLDLEGNLNSGSLPLEFDGLRNLKVLNLGFNEIIGGIPSSFSNCSKLQVINLSGNQLNGSIPGFLGRLSDLRGLYMSFNLLTGPIPGGIGDNCGKLEHLELSGNFLTNSIPKAFGNCRELQTLLLYSNLLEGAIPSELGALNHLEVLDVSRNNFAEAIPPELGNCSKLSILVLSNLWQPLPNVSMEKFASTADDFNFYDGTIPAGVTSLPSLKMLWAPRATLQGNFPPSWSSCSNLEMLNLGQNFYAGTISEGLQNCKGLYFLDLSSNKLTGEISEQIPVPCMTFLDVSGNYLSGSFPSFSYSTCGPVQSLHGGFSEPNDAPAVYLSYFRYRSQIENLHFGEDDSFSVLHDFSSNNLTGRLQSMPIATERLGKQTIYTFLAGNNKLAGTIPGVLFDKCDQVRGIMVNVSSNSLSGQVPSNISMACESLMLLDLSWNPLQGSIPSSLGQISLLQSLSLSGNNLNGPIPASLGQLHSLKVLELSSNSLTGEIPIEIVNLRNLTTLLLNNNSLSGPIPPELANISTLMQFNVSFNNLSGPVQMNIFKCNSFIGNPSLHCSAISSSAPSPQDGREPNGDDDTSSPQNSGGKKASLNTIAIACIVSAVAIVSVFLALIVVFFYTRKWKPRSRVSGTARKNLIVFTDIGVPLTFENVVRATGNFSASNCIGNGGFGATYKAEIEPGCVVAVKRLSVGRLLGVQQFDAEIKTLGRFHHPNLVTLIGYHGSEKEMFLLYNYLPGGNLEKFIQERSTRACDWRTLHKISLDVAKALSYLHDQCVPRVLHRDVKPSNILLDEEYNAYLSDFGLARLLGTSETHATTGVKGTFGYVAPEYAMTCRVSGKADVYSYGVVLLELISSKKALDPSFSSYGNGFNIVTWASMLLAKRRAKEVFVKELWDSGPHDDLVEVVRMAVRCTDERLSDRPAMKDVVRQLRQLRPPS